MPFPTPSTPAQIVANATEQVTNLLHAVTTSFSPVSSTIESVNTSILQLGKDFTTGISQNLSLIQKSITDGINNLNARGNDALTKLLSLVSDIPNPGDLIDKVTGSFGKITINGKEIRPDPQELYLTMRKLLISKDPISIKLEGPMFLPLYPILNSNSNDLHSTLRNIVLPAFKLPPDSQVLNSDPVTITALIIIAIIILGAPLVMAMGIAIAAIFLALAAVLIISACQGRDITTDICPKIGVTGNATAGVGVNVVSQMCGIFKISGPIRNDF